MMVKQARRNGGQGAIAPPPPQPNCPYFFFACQLRGQSCTLKMYPYPILCKDCHTIQSYGKTCIIMHGGRALSPVQGGPERMQHLYDQLFQENRGQNKQVVCIIAY